MQGTFISFEGVDGVGKTTQVERLRAYVESQGRECVVTREPGGTALGVAIRKMLLHGVDTGDENDCADIAPRAEALLFAADRAQHVAEVILPGSATRRGGHHRPVSRFLFGVPGGRPRADGRGNPKPEHVGHERSAAGTHVSAGYGPGAIACARCSMPKTAWRRPATTSSVAHAVAFLDLAEREPERFHVIDASQYHRRRVGAYQSRFRHREHR